MKNVKMKKPSHVVSIDSTELRAVSGGVAGLVGLREQARTLDSVAPNSVSVSAGPVSASWNVAPRPFSRALDAVGYPQQDRPQPQPRPRSRWDWLGGVV